MWLAYDQERKLVVVTYGFKWNRDGKKKLKIKETDFVLKKNPSS